MRQDENGSLDENLVDTITHHIESGKPATIPVSADQLPQAEYLARRLELVERSRADLVTFEVHETHT